MWMVYVILGTSLWRNTGSNVQHCTSPCIRCRQPTTIINARCSLVSLWWRSGCFFCYCLLFILSYTGLKMRTILDTEGGLRTCRCVQEAQEGYIVSASLPSTITFWLPINILVHNAIFSKFPSPLLCNLNPLSRYHLCILLWYYVFRLLSADFSTLFLPVCLPNSCSSLSRSQTLRGVHWYRMRWCFTHHESVSLFQSPTPPNRNPPIHPKSVLVVGGGQWIEWTPSVVGCAIVCSLPRVNEIPTCRRVIVPRCLSGHCPPPHHHFVLLLFRYLLSCSTLAQPLSVLCCLVCSPKVLYYTLTEEGPRQHHTWVMVLLPGLSVPEFPVPEKTVMMTRYRSNVQMWAI